jgi:hypothetical protein
MLLRPLGCVCRAYVTRVQTICHMHATWSPGMKGPPPPPLFRDATPSPSVNSVASAAAATAAAQQVPAQVRASCAPLLFT